MSRPAISKREHHRLSVTCSNLQPIAPDETVRSSKTNNCHLLVLPVDALPQSAGDTCQSHSSLRRHIRARNFPRLDSSKSVAREVESICHCRHLWLTAAAHRSSLAARDSVRAHL
jgi:hypothetical protein